MPQEKCQRDAASDDEKQPGCEQCRRKSILVGQKTEDTGLEFSANRGTSISEREADLVSTKLLMGLPDLQYFGVVNRAEVVKGRIPVLTLPEGVN